MFTHYDRKGQYPEGQKRHWLVEEGEFVSGVVAREGEEEGKLGKGEDGVGDKQSVEIKGLPLWVGEVPKFGVEVRGVVKVEE